MSTAVLCDFDLSLHLCGDGLLGANKEYNPYFEVHGTFGAHCVKDKMELKEVGRENRSIASLPITAETNNKNQTGGQPEEWHQYDGQVVSYQTTKTKNFRLESSGTQTRVDECVTAELWCHTRLSGIKELDRRESKFVERHVSCGLFQLPVAQIMAIFRENQVPLGQPFVVEATVVDDKIVEAKLREYFQEERLSQQELQRMPRERYNNYIKRAMDETHKGRVKFEIKMREFSHQLYTSSVFHIQDFQARTCMATSGAFHADGSYRTEAVASTMGAHHHHGNRGHHHGGRMPGGGDPPVLVLQPSESDPGTVELVTGGSGGGGTINVAAAFSPLSHTSQLGQQRMLECMEKCVLQVYVQNFMKLSPLDPEPLYQPSNNNVKNLQFLMWVSKMGRGPAISYFACHDPTTRVYASESARQEQLRLYGYDQKTENYLKMLLKSSLRRMGLSKKAFEYEMRNHFSPENQSTELSHLFAVCEDVVARLGTFAANSAYYTADYRMVRKRTKGGDLARMIVLDSWDNTILNDSGRSDDCEGQDNTATTIIRAFGTGRQELGFKWKSSLLNAVQLYLKHSVIYDLGATVTSAFFDTSNKAVDLHKGDLPMVGDAMDQRSKCDGHCHALMESFTNCLTRLSQGNLSKEKLAKLQALNVQSKAFMMRDAKRSMLLLEGTGTIEPRILPVKESFAQNPVLQDKKLAERNFSRALRERLAKLKETDKAMATNLAEMFNGEGLPHYVEQQDPQRRVSDFYNEVVHGCSVELYKMLGIEYSQFAFTKQGDDGQHRYGVKIGGFMRTTDRYALMFPFAEASPQWIQEVTQLTECVQHQLPLMAFGRYNERQYAQVHSTFIEPPPSAGTNMKKTQQEFETLIAEVAANPSLTVVRLQTRQWKLDESPEKTKALLDFIAQSQGLVSHAYYSEHHLPVCDPMIEILCVVDVATCLKLAVNGG